MNRKRELQSAGGSTVTLLSSNIWSSMTWTNFVLELFSQGRSLNNPTDIKVENEIKIMLDDF